jgi:hypothetical protein
LRKISRASDSVWHVASTLEEAEYEELKARRDAHRADAAKMSDSDLHEAHDDLADDIELDKHNEYPFFEHFLSSPVGEAFSMPERTPAQKAHDDLKVRREAFGDELDARGLWGPKADADREKFNKRLEDWPKNYGHRERLIQQGILKPEESYSGDGGIDRYMGESGFDLDKAKTLGEDWQKEIERRNNRKITQLFGYNGFDPANPEHQAIFRGLARGQGGS